MLFFIILFINHLILVFIRYLPALTYPRSTNLFFFVGGQTLKPPLKAVTWDGKAEALLQAFGLKVGSCGLANVLTTVRWKLAD
jgi:hypothetical protein